MADQEDDELLLDTPAEGEAPEAGEEEQGSPQPGDEGEEELEVTFEDGTAPVPGERETELVKHLRQVSRDQGKRLAELEKGQPSQRIEVGDEPTLESCEYDEPKFKESWRAWEARRVKAAEAETEADQSTRLAREEWERDEQAYRDKRAMLPFADVEEAEALALGSLSKVQYAALVMAAKDPAKVLYALGKHPGKLADISRITNPLKLAAAVAVLEGTLTVTKRRKAPEPEEIARGSAPISKATDKQLARLEEEAARTGDRTELVRYKKSQKQAA